MYIHITSGSSWLGRQEDRTPYTKLKERKIYNFIFKCMSNLIVCIQILLKLDQVK